MHCESSRFRRDGTGRSRHCSRSSTGGNAGLMPEAAAHPAAPGFHRLAVTSIDRESADVLSVTMQSLDGQPLPEARPGQYIVLRLQPTAGGAPIFRSYSLSGPALGRALSNQREDRAERCGWNVAAGSCTSWRCSRRQFPSRQLHSASRRAAGGAAQRRDRGDTGAGDAPCVGGGRGRPGKYYGSTPLEIANIIPLPPKSAA